MEQTAEATKKKTIEKANFCLNTIFSTGVIKFHNAKRVAFSVNFMFRVQSDQKSTI